MDVQDGKRAMFLGTQGEYRHTRAAAHVERGYITRAAERTGPGEKERVWKELCGVAEPARGRRRPYVSVPEGYRGFD